MADTWKKQIPSISHDCLCPVALKDWLRIALKDWLRVALKDWLRFAGTVALFLVVPRCAAFSNP